MDPFEGRLLELLRQRALDATPGAPMYTPDIMSPFYKQRVIPPPLAEMPLGTLPNVPMPKVPEDPFWDFGPGRGQF